MCIYIEREIDINRQKTIYIFIYIYTYIYTYVENAHATPPHLDVFRSGCYGEMQGSSRSLRMGVWPGWILGLAGIVLGFRRCAFHRRSESDANNKSDNYNKKQKDMFDNTSQLLAEIETTSLILDRYLTSRYEKRCLRR